MRGERRGEDERGEEGRGQGREEAGGERGGEGGNGSITPAVLIVFWERQQLVTVCVSVQPSKLPLLVCANSACVAGSVHVHSSDLQQQHWGKKK